jgi:cobalt/nickel transport system permease protein
MAAKRTTTWAVVVGGLLVALGLAFFVSRFASSSPDGLNKVAIDQGFDDTQTDHATTNSPFAGYGVEGVHDQGLSTGIAGIIGVAVTFGLGLLIFVVVGRRKGSGGDSEAASATASSGSAP